MKDLARLLNASDEHAARAALINCCAATAWVEAMMDRRPFADDAAALAAAESCAASLDEMDWLTAFAAHPMIGDVDSLRARYAATKLLAAREQLGVEAASEATLAEMARLNREYRERFGFIFIVCAAGKTAEEMLHLLRSRIGNSREAELSNAVTEQLQITRLRLQKLAAAARGS